MFEILCMLLIYALSWLRPKHQLGLEVLALRHQRQLRQILASYFNYYHDVRPYRSLEHDGPIPRPVQLLDCGKVVEIPLVGGRHHHYQRQAA